MLVLAIDTALDACSAALWADGSVLASRREPMERGHQERLAPMVAEVMAEARAAFAALDRIAVTVGPGSFTGLRVGLAFAKAAALALGRPCLGVGTLEALLASSALAGAPRVAAVLDGRRGQVHLQAFASGEPLSAPANLSLAEARALLAELAVPPAALVGSGAALLGGDDLGGGVDPVVVARLAAARTPADAPARPLYLRAPDARTLAERAAAAAPATARP